MNQSADLRDYTRLPVIASIDQSTLPELSLRQVIFVPMCARADGRVCCQSVELVDEGEPTIIDHDMRFYSQPVHARLKDGQDGCAVCRMPQF